MLKLFKTENGRRRCFAWIGRFSFVFLFTFQISVSPILAKSLSEYKENVVVLKEDFLKIIVSSSSLKQDNDFENEIFEKARRLLPTKDQIEFEGATINVNNEWLVRKIDKYLEKSTKFQERRVILVSIFEHLGAIELKLDELENAQAEGESKDANKRKITDILSREEYGNSKDEDSAIMRFFYGILDWLASITRLSPLSAKPSDFRSTSFVIQISLYVLAFGVIAFLVYRFAPQLINRFIKQKKKLQVERVVLGEKLPVHETSGNLFQEAERLAREGNLKAAIRKAYISLLFKLSEQKIVALAKHKTNRDYLDDVKEEGALFRNMNRLTLNYERHWYGFAPAGKKDWDEFLGDYEKALDRGK